ncbi:MAG: hypothetical protein ACRCZN_02500 [Lactococcus lactis]
MTINLTYLCRQCGFSKPNAATGELSNDEYSILTCKNGHTIKYFLGLPDYSLFFDHGIDAYNEGNYFEAFTSIYHSWERFLIIASQVMLLYRNKSYELTKDIIKPIQNSSVKIEGGFSLIYGSFFNQPAPKLSKKTIETRNKIIHGTRNPQKEDVEKCVMDVFNFIKPIEIKFYMETEPYSLINLFSLYKESSLTREGIISKAELANGEAQIMNEGQHILGTTPEMAGPTAHTMFSFEEMTERRKSMKKMEEQLATLHNK